jgi:hypothetical protein
MTTRYFEVKGSWPFPYDMLRYDHCYPANESDSLALTEMANGATEGIVTVKLMSNSPHAPTHKRWESFLWKAT